MGGLRGLQVNGQCSLPGVVIELDRPLIFQEVYTREDTNHSDGKEEGKLDKMIRFITNRIDELDDSWKRRDAQNADTFRFSTASDYRVGGGRRGTMCSSLEHDGRGGGGGGGGGGGMLMMPISCLQITLFV